MDRYNLIISFISTVAIFFSSPTVWGDISGTLMPVNEIISASYDKHGEVQLLASVYYSNGCYAPLKTIGEYDQRDNIIQIGHYARQFDGECIQVILPKFQNVRLGFLQEGNYLIMDAASKTDLGELIISKERATLISR